MMMVFIHLPSRPFLTRYRRNTVKRSRREWRNCGLHTDFHSLKGTESHICNDFGRGTGSKVQGRLVPVGILVARQIRIELLEELIASILESTLSLYGISKPCV